MRRTILITVALLVALPSAAGAQDLREAWQKAEEARRTAEERQEQIEQEILNDRGKLLSEVERLEAEQAALEEQLAGLEQYIVDQTNEKEELEDEWAQSELDFKEISGNVRLAARDVETMLHQSYFTAFRPERLDQVSPLLDSGYFPDIHDISGMVDEIFAELRMSGQVAMHETRYTGRDGVETTGKVLTLGKFTAIYETPAEVGFLRYSPESQRFVALAKLPSGGMAGDMRDYLAGEGARVPIDMSGGNALAAVTHSVTLAEQLRLGGPVVWPILGLAALALIIIVTRIFFLNRIHHNTDRFMGEVNELAAEGDWQGCEELVERNSGRKSPVISVIRAGLSVRHQDREIQESVMQEAILHQMPRVERGLSLLAVLAAVAPLLGLLGTVSGMINTFRVITLFGTGDPKLMSGGISEALITTQLGLAVAIPIMLAHTFLSRRSDHIVGDMEEKGVQMINIIQTRRTAERAAEAAGGAA